MAENHLEQLNSLLRRCGLGFCQEDIEAIDFIVKENEELKKQLEVGEEQYNDLVKETEELKTLYDSTILEKENQQKEFIAYLENEIQSCELTCDLIFNHNKEMKIYKIILLKYKEIIGGNNGN